MKQEIARCKEILVGYMQKIEYDFDAIEYLIDTMDYLLSDRIPCNKSVLDIIIEDVLIASTYHKSKELLEVAALLKVVLDGVKECMR